MSKSEPVSPATDSTTSSDPIRPENGERSVDAEVILPLLSDDHARAILAALGRDPLPAVEVVDRVSASRSTVYRRLADLESAGVVASSIRARSDGHHRHRFRLAVDAVRFSFGADGVAIEAVE